MLPHTRANPLIFGFSGKTAKGVKRERPVSNSRPRVSGMCGRREPGLLFRIRALHRAPVRHPRYAISLLTRGAGLTNISEGWDEGRRRTRGVLRMQGGRRGRDCFIQQFVCDNLRRDACDFIYDNYRVEFQWQILSRIGFLHNKRIELSISIDVKYNR